MNVFDVVNNISLRKENMKSLEGFDKAYIPVIVNKAFSYYLDTIMLANEMNRLSFLDKDMQYDFYRMMIKPRKRFAKWIKKNEKEQEIISSIQEYFQCNETRAKEYIKLLNGEQIKIILKSLDKGGR